MLTLLSQLSVALGVPAAGILSQDTIWSFGTFAKTGASVSVEDILCTPVDIFPQASVAVHVRIMVKPSAQPPVPPSVVSAKLMFTLLSQLSVAITFTVAAAGKTSPQPAIISAGLERLLRLVLYYLLL